MFLVGAYLFSGDNLEAYLGGRRDAALKALSEISPDDIRAKGRNAVLRDLRDRFAVPQTTLHVDDAYFQAERALKPDELEAIGARPEDSEKFKALSIVIPFSGDEHLLTCTPNIYSANQPQADVADGKVTVTYFINEVEEMQLENNFKRLVALVERTLEVTQWQAMGHNEKLTDALSAALAERLGA